jgi:chromosome segregation ATPase
MAKKVKEVGKVYKQLDVEKKEVRSLQYRLETSSNEEVINSLMAKNNELKLENTALHKEIKACEKIQSQQSKELMKVEEEADYYNKIKSQNEEIRMYKTKIRELQAEKDSTQALKDKIFETESKLREAKRNKKQSLSVSEPK